MHVLCPQVGLTIKLCEKDQYEVVTATYILADDNDAEIQGARPPLVFLHVGFPPAAGLVKLQRRQLLRIPAGYCSAVKLTVGRVRGPSAAWCALLGTGAPAAAAKSPMEISMAGGLVADMGGSSACVFLPPQPPPTQPTGQPLYTYFIPVAGLQKGISPTVSYLI